MQTKYFYRPKNGGKTFEKMCSIREEKTLHFKIK